MQHDINLEFLKEGVLLQADNDLIALRGNLRDMRCIWDKNPSFQSSYNKDNKLYIVTVKSQGLGVSAKYDRENERLIAFTVAFGQGNEVEVTKIDAGEWRAASSRPGQQDEQIISTIATRTQAPVLITISGKNDTSTPALS